MSRQLKEPELEHVFWAQESQQRSCRRSSGSAPSVADITLAAGKWDTFPCQQHAGQAGPQGSLTP